MSAFDNCPLPGKGPGRPKGSPNKIPTVVRQALLLAAEQAGRANHPECPFDGLVAYLEDVARQHPKLFLRLLSRVLPLEFAGKLRNLPVQPRLQL